MKESKSNNKTEGTPNFDKPKQKVVKSHRTVTEKLRNKKRPLV